MAVWKPPRSWPMLWASSLETRSLQYVQRISVELGGLAHSPELGLTMGERSKKMLNAAHASSELQTMAHWLGS